MKRTLIKIAEIMTPEVQCVLPDFTLAEAARLLRDLDVGALPICDDEQLVGMITDRDLVVRGMAEDCDPDEVTVGEIMSPDILHVFDDQDIREAATLMEDRQIRRLPVLDRNRQLVGILSIADLALGSDNLAESGHALRGISRPPSEDTDIGVRALPIV